MALKKVYLNGQGSVVGDMSGKRPQYSRQNYDKISAVS